MYAPFIFPHCPFYVAEPWYSMHDRDAMPSGSRQTRGHEPQFRRALRDVHTLDDLTDEQWAEIIATHYGMVSRLDSQVGRILDALDRSGQADDTVILFWSDHGEYLGDYGLIEKWPSGREDCLVRNPLIMAGPGIPPGTTSRALVELIDIVPTVHDFADITASYTQFGRSLMHLFGDPTSEHRSYTFSEGGFLVEEEHLAEYPTVRPYDLKGGLQHDQPTANGKAVAVRSDQWTYVWRLYEPPELYDRVADPHETVNRAGDPELTDIEAQLREEFLRWFVETCDVMPWESMPRVPDVDLPRPGAWLPAR